DSGLGGLESQSLAVSADGKSLYTASALGAAVARFDRSQATGATSYKGCITGDTDLGPSGSGACVQIPSATPGGDNSGLGFLSSPAVSADGKSLYAASDPDSAMARFRRRPATGALDYRGCITGETGLGPSRS